MRITDELSRHPTEKASTEENYEEIYVNNNLKELFELHYKYGQILNENRKFRPVDQLHNRVLMTNQKLTNEIKQPIKVDSDSN